MNILKITLKRNVLLVSCLVFGLGTVAFGQTSSLINLRFANPKYDARADQYTVDVELKATGSPQEIFGMNVRFFYDASELEFLSLDAIHPSYALLGGAPGVFKGNSDSGPEMFNFEESAAYVNGAVQLMMEDAPLKIVTNQWTKFFEARFKIPDFIPEGALLCPSLIWDLKAYVPEEGLFPGDNGVRLTLMENKPQTREISAPCIVQSIPFNWEFQYDEIPYGQPLSTECITVGGAVTSSQDVVDENGYALFQNFPNPFYDETIIKFNLPREEEATLIFSDATGRVVRMIQGDYKAGENVVKIRHRDLFQQGGILFYRLETAEYTSRVLKMTVIER